MKKYRKKPVVIEAERFVCREARDLPQAERLAQWCDGTLHYDSTDQSASLDIPTLEGTMKANPGDWIIRGVKGEFYPCKPDIFEETYERAD
jgi:hypothetical protein